ncbi:hypothetical protein STIAU_2612 [Stigmatella aurantiaca DW4/3-1]|uniref:Uncharacterized protein n=1 Tax=Stigmatella aurantiaca (strain DW4/3-1) TaxID=378806 RepID=Q08W77_STIAD|nr:hypothetical protein STIAU_2612 [Stigmatella aurantiaca DW4/3-1]
MSQRIALVGVDDQPPPGMREAHVALGLGLGAQGLHAHGKGVARGVGRAGREGGGVHLQQGIAEPIHVEVEPEAEEVLVVDRDHALRDLVAIRLVLRMRRLARLGRYGLGEHDARQDHLDVQGAILLEEVVQHVVVVLDDDAERHHQLDSSPGFVVLQVGVVVLPQDAAVPFIEGEGARGFLGLAGGVHVRRREEGGVGGDVDAWVERAGLVAKGVLPHIEGAPPGPRVLGIAIGDEHFGEREAVEDLPLPALVCVGHLVEDRSFARMDFHAEAPVLPAHLIARQGEVRALRLGQDDRVGASAKRSHRLLVIGPHPLGNRDLPSVDDLHHLLGREVDEREQTLHGPRIGIDRVALEEGEAFDQPVALELGIRGRPHGPGVEVDGVGIGHAAPEQGRPPLRVLPHEPLRLVEVLHAQGGLDTGDPRPALDGARRGDTDDGLEGLVPCGVIGHHEHTPLDGVSRLEALQFLFGGLPGSNERKRGALVHVPLPTQELDGLFVLRRGEGLQRVRGRGRLGLPRGRCWNRGVPLSSTREASEHQGSQEPDETRCVAHVREVSSVSGKRLANRHGRWGDAASMDGRTGSVLTRSRPGYRAEGVALLRGGLGAPGHTERSVPAMVRSASALGWPGRQASTSVRPGPGGAKGRTTSCPCRFSMDTASWGSRVMLPAAMTICASVVRLVARKSTSCAPTRVHSASVWLRKQCPSSRRRTFSSSRSRSWTCFLRSRGCPGGVAASGSASPARAPPPAARRAPPLGWPPGAAGPRTGRPSAPPPSGCPPPR